MGEPIKRYNVEPLRTPEEIYDMCQAIRRWCGERDLFLFKFGINTGLRVSDIVTLKVEDVAGKRHAKIREKKSGKARSVLLRPIQADIEEYIQGMQPGDWLFPSRKGTGHIRELQAYRQLVKAAEMIDRDDIGTHTMRKTFGYHYYKRTKDIVSLQMLFNHSSPAVTKRYIGITQDELDDSLAEFRLG